MNGKKILTEAGIYIISNIISKAIVFLLLPLLTHFLLPSDYGIFVLIQVAVSFLVPIVSLNSNAAVQREFFLVNNTEFSQYVSGTLLMNIIVVAILFLLSFFIGAYISKLLFVSIFWLNFIIILAFGQTLFNLVLAIWQCEKNAKYYAFFSIMQTVIRFVLTILPVIYFNDKLNALLYGYAISIILFAFISIIILLRKKLIKLMFIKEKIIAFLKYGLPLVPHQIGGWFMGMADRIVIASKLSLSDVGFYNLGFSFGSGVGLVQDSFNKAWVPYLYKKLTINDEKSKSELAAFTILYSIIQLILALLIALITPILFLVIDNKYYGAKPFVMWISFAYAINGIYKMYTNYIFFSNKTYYLSFITFISGVIEILLVFLLINISGLLGAAFAFLLTQIFFCILTIYFSNKLYKLNYFNGIKIIILKFKDILNKKLNINL